MSSSVAPSWVILLAVAACAPRELDEQGSPELGSLEQESNILTTVAWPMVSGIATIPVCWETAGFATEKGWVRAAIEASYEVPTFFHVNFTGWGNCTSSSRGVRIRAVDSRPRTEGLGTRLDGVRNGMDLNFQFEIFERDYCSRAVNGEARFRSCIEGISRHEFGHALGLAHEHLREDLTASCEAQIPAGELNSGTEGDVIVGNFDSSSAMSYCTGAYTFFLTPGDIAGLARLYGGGADVFVADSNGIAFASGAARLDLGCQVGDVCQLGDVNGDGRDDLIVFERSGAGAIYVALALPTGGGLQTRTRWHAGFCISPQHCLVGDFTGDGKADVARISTPTVFLPERGEVEVAPSLGSSFGASARWHASFGAAQGLLYTREFHAGDFNGDGKDDFLSVGGRPNRAVQVLLSGGTALATRGSAPSVWLENFCSSSGDLFGVGDVDGNRKVDAICFQRSLGDVFVMRSTGTNFKFSSGEIWHRDFAYADQVARVADINRDGRADVVRFDRGSTGKVFAATASSSSNKFGIRSQWSTGFCLQQDECALGDLHGDGRADAVAFKRE